MLEPALADEPGQAALVAPDRTLSYAELDAAARAAGALTGLGLRRGDRIGVGLPNDCRIVVAFHAAMRLGVIWVGISQQLAPLEQATLLDHCQATLTIGCAADPSPARGRRALHPGEWADTVRRQPGGADSCGPVRSRRDRVHQRDDRAPQGVVHSQHNLLVPGAVLVATRGYDSSLRKADSLPLTILNLQVLSTLLTSQAKGTSIISGARRSAVWPWLRATGATVWNAVPRSCTTWPATPRSPPAPSTG